jgi:hypothetical protein
VRRRLLRTGRADRDLHEATAHSFFKKLARRLHFASWIPSKKPSPFSRRNPRLAGCTSRTTPGSARYTRGASTGSTGTWALTEFWTMETRSGSSASSTAYGTSGRSSASKTSVRRPPTIHCRRWRARELPFSAHITASPRFSTSLFFAASRVELLNQPDPRHLRSSSV